MALPRPSMRSLNTAQLVKQIDTVLSRRSPFAPRQLHSARSPSAPSRSLNILSRTSGRQAHENLGSCRSYATVVVQSQARSRLRRGISFLIISTLSFGFGAYYAIHYAPPVLNSVTMGSHVPSDQETLSMYQPPDEFSREIDAHIRDSALAQSLRNDPTWRESRPSLKIPEAVRQHNLTAGTLSGPGMIVVPPYYFNKKDGSEMVQIIYVGTDVSGHPGIVHGGFIATMLDEGLARCCFPAMQNKVGVTANLSINYRKPTMAGQFLVLRAQTTKVEGRKAWAKGWIESMEVAEGEEPEKLVEAEALFVEPKHAKFLKSLYRVTS